MNLQFLGDALDHWKGSMFARLQKEALLQDFSVDPMLTDAKDWNTADFKLYADLLHVRIDQIVPLLLILLTSHFLSKIGRGRLA